MKAEPCKRCGAIPEVVEVSGLFYCQCTGFYNKKIAIKNNREAKYVIQRVKCDKWSPYEFLGTTPKTAIANWNDFNTKRILDTEE